MKFIVKYSIFILSISYCFNNGNTIDNKSNNISDIKYDINYQNKVIYNKITEKIIIAQQQLDAFPEDEEIADYINYLKELQKTPNISQKLACNELVHFYY